MSQLPMSQVAMSQIPAQRAPIEPASIEPPTRPDDTGSWQTGDTSSWQSGESSSWQSGETGSWQSGETDSSQSGETGSWQSGETGSWQIGDTGSRQIGDTGSRQTGDTGSWQTDGSADWRTDTGSRAGHDVRDLRDASRRTPAPEPEIGPREVSAEARPPRQPKIVTVGIAALSAVVLLAGAIIGAMYFSGSDDSLDTVLKLGAAGSDSRVVTAPLDNRNTASFELLAGANKVTVRIGELGDDLYRISTPEDAGIRPSPTIRNDAVQLQVTRDGDGTGGEIDVVLAAKVNWALRFAGYVQEEIIDFTEGKISGVEMVGAARRAELTLPKPAGTVPIKVAGAIEELTVTSPAGSPVRIQVGGGAQTVVAGNRTLRDVAPGSTLTPKDWATDNRYDVSAVARVTSMTVTTQN
ncbi:hypothetical protein ACWKSP_08970 [Micromonosporaceae bacterium Da 78-11]